MTERQITAAVLMIRPASFCMNSQTVSSNKFQHHADVVADPNSLAQVEFDCLAAALTAAKVCVIPIPDTTDPCTPDALFPNNWVSLHADGTVVMYPMLAPNRRLERRDDILDALANVHKFRISRVVDLSHWEQDGKYLEGTGSLVLDRVNHIAYACLSPRTHLEALGEFARLLDYELIAFEANDANGIPIYHTNVLLSLGTQFALVCAEAIRLEQRAAVLGALRSSHPHLLEITPAQMHEFAANVLELATTDGRRVVALSSRAAASLSPPQREQLADASGALVTASIPTIETLGGGSVRCMLAEIHLPNDARP